MKLLVPVWLLAAALHARADGALGSPDTSVYCRPTEASSALKRFDFDLYLTGHPMGGIYSYSGLFAAEGADPACTTTRGPLRTKHLDRRGPSVTYEGSSSCLSEATYELTVQTGFYERGRRYPATLTVQIEDPLGSGSKSVYELSCGL